MKHLGLCLPHLGARRIHVKGSYLLERPLQELLLA